MLNEFGPKIWLADGPTVTAAAGFHYPTRMVVMQLANGNLALWSPTALSGELCAAIDALGTVSHLIAPNTLHHMFLADWQSAYPDALVYAPPALRDKRRDIRFDVDLDDNPISAFAGDIDHVLMHGNRITTEAVFFHRPSGTAIVTDLIQQFPRNWFSGWRSLVAGLDLMTAAEPTVPRKFRVAFTDRRAARTSLRAILEWPVRRVIMAHGPPITDDGLASLRRAFRWLDVPSLRTT